LDHANRRFQPSERSIHKPTRWETVRQSEYKIDKLNANEYL